MNAPMQPTYYVRHPDDTYSEADPQPVLLTKDVPLVMLCSKCFGWAHINGSPCDHCGGVGHYAAEPPTAAVASPDGATE